MAMADATTIRDPLPALERELAALDQDDPASLPRWEALRAAIASTPAATKAGIMAKIRALRAELDWGDQAYQGALLDGLARDVERLAR